MTDLALVERWKKRYMEVSEAYTEKAAIVSRLERRVDQLEADAKRLHEAKADHDADIAAIRKDAAATDEVLRRMSARLERATEVPAKAKDESKAAGGVARSQALSPTRRKEICKNAADARWAAQAADRLAAKLPKVLP